MKKWSCEGSTNFHYGLLPNYPIIPRNGYSVSGLAQLATVPFSWHMAYYYHPLLRHSKDILLCRLFVLSTKHCVVS